MGMPSLSMFPLLDNAKNTQPLPQHHLKVSIGGIMLKMFLATPSYESGGYQCLGLDDARGIRYLPRRMRMKWSFLAFSLSSMDPQTTLWYSPMSK